MKHFIIFVGLVIYLNSYAQTDTIWNNKLIITFEDSVDFDSTQINYTIAINEWSSGIYLCEVSADGEVLFTDKLIKE